MPLNIPTLPALREQTRAQLIARITRANPALRRMLVKVLGDVMTGTLYLLYRFVVILSQQLFLDSAEGLYLQRQASNEGISKKGAAFAAGNAVFTGSPDLIPVPSGLLLQNADATVQFTTQAAGVITAGTLTLPVKASTGGVVGNLSANAPLTLMVAIAGVQPTALVATGGLTGGLDAESDDSLRARALDHRRNPPQGGAPNDYVQWALAVVGVTRAWCYPLNRGPGTVDVTFVMDGRANNIPLSGDVATVQAAIDAVKPVTADSIVFASAGDLIPVTIAGLVPNTTATQAAIRTSLAALFGGTTPGGATIGSGVAAGVPGGFLYLEQISDAISQAGGISGFTLVAPVGNITSANGHIPRLGVVTFT